MGYHYNNMQCIQCIPKLPKNCAPLIRKLVVAVPTHCVDFTLTDRHMQPTRLRQGPLSNEYPGKTGTPLSPFYKRISCIVLWASTSMPYTLLRAIDHRHSKLLPSPSCRWPCLSDSAWETCMGPLDAVPLQAFTRRYVRLPS